MAKKDYCPNFSCDYFSSPDDALKGLFWADERAKMNFYVFGDVVSFDATYRHNKYNLVFVSFTGIDNHNQNFTLVAAFLGSQTAESYIWLLKCFKRAFGYEPSVVVTDQDPTMKRAIEDVFPNSRHRLCMWHIMDKLSGKVGSNLRNTINFKTRLCDILWMDSITPELFEKEWASIMNNLQLNNHDWLEDIFHIRQSWIPAYYREETMSGLMRTSSRSESENHFFRKFCNPRCTLVEFLAHFDTALDHQRHEHRKKDHDCRYKRAETWSNFALEKQVMIRKEDVTVYCSCKRFEQFGLLIRHIFKVLHILDIRVFPKQYINRRWTKDVFYNSPMWSIGFDEPNIDKSTDVYRVVRDINIAHDRIINKLVTDMEKLQHYCDYINQYKSTVDEVTFDAPRPSRRDMFVELTSVTQPKQINIPAPIGVRNKGCGLPICYRSLREQAIGQSQLDKPTRTCRICHEPGHDARNHHKYHINENTSADGPSSSHNENMEE
ncbi:protein FAR1-RELATED SEQUENCE 5-like [Bidens hawaiensis]|uniref:protein FAR1-RELATED SEQUENCE 5-like n=1 Tax=Bidens hawaiensis TaxID=980011 RepID=UPI00404B81EC